MTHQVYPSTGYGPRMKLMFTGDEQDYDIWEVRFLGYMALQGLKETILPSSTTVDSTKNERAYAELVMLLDEKSLSMIMTDAMMAAKLWRYYVITIKVLGSLGS